MGRIATAQRAADEEVLREAESTGVYMTVPSGARSNTCRTCYVTYLETCIPPRRNSVVLVPIGHIGLLANWVVTLDFDRLEIGWQECLHDERSSAEVKSRRVLGLCAPIPLPSMTALVEIRRACTTRAPPLRSKNRRVWLMWRRCHM